VGAMTEETVREYKKKQEIEDKKEEKAESL
jgi:hypothetical protein